MTIIPLHSSVVVRLLPIHSDFVNAKKRFDDATGLLKDMLDIPVDTAVHLDLVNGTISFEEKTDGSNLS